jgi:putative tryptophan/tyrosine transport system substrate-binding protein
MGRRASTHLAIAVATLISMASSLPAMGQQPLVGVMAIDKPELGAAAGWDKVFGGQLRALGYKIGETLQIEYRWARGDITQYPKLARELIARRPAVIVAPCGPSLRAIRNITRTLPVIALCADERNFLGEIASFSRPGGYTTGVTFLSEESLGKRLELLREMNPALSKLAILYEPDDPIESNWRALERLAPTIGLGIVRVPVERVEDFHAAFETILRERAQAVYVFPTNRMIAESARIAELGRKNRVATISEFSLTVDAGGLISYGGTIEEWLGKTIPLYVDKILKGAKPGDLPVVQPTQFELVVNIGTAKAIGVTIPRSILARANRVVE